MSNHSRILHKRSAVSGTTPTQLSAGELAMNIHDGLLFVQNISGGIEKFSSDRYAPFILDTELSACAPQYGGNTVSQIFSNVLGGYRNDVSGAGSSTVNGENNDIQGDFAFIGSGADNKILSSGDFSAILGGQSNAISHRNCFALGSYLSSHADNFTYVNNISGKFWGQGTELYGSSIVPGVSSYQFATTAFVQEAVTSGTAVAGTVVAQVVNVDTVALTRGMAVYAFGSQGDKVSVKRAAAGQDSTSSKTLGIVNETIDINGIGYITLGGTMSKLSLGPPFVAGDSLWLGTDPGTFTRVKPVAPIHSVFIGVVERANAGNGTAYIKIQNGYELDELHDVLITDPQASEVLQRNEANTLWVNKTLASQTPQTISFVDNTKQLSISNGNTISLSALVDSSLDTGVRNLTSSWDSTYSTVKSNSATSWRNSLSASVFADQTVGSIIVGDTVPVGTTLQQFVEKLLTATFYPSFTNPSATLTSNLASIVESGTTGISLTVNYDRGAITGKTVSLIWQPTTFQDYRAGAATNYVINGTNNGTTSSYTDGSVVIADGSNSFTSTVTYGTGPQPVDSKGANYSTALAGSTISPGLTVTGRRRAFYGVDSLANSSATIRSLGSSTLNPSNGTSFAISIPAGTTSVVFAYPSSLQDVSSVKESVLNAEVKTAFSQTTVSVQGANSYTGTNYKVYRFAPVEAFPSSVTYTVTI